MSRAAYTFARGSSAWNVQRKGLARFEHRAVSGVPGLQVVDLNIEAFGDHIKRITFLDLVIGRRGFGLLVIAGSLEKECLADLEIAA